MDSEHNALFQAIGARDPDTIEKMTITASGGPFREWSAERISAAFPYGEVVRIKRDEPIGDDVSGDVLVAGFGTGALISTLAPRVTWVHVMGTGIDWLPPEAFDVKVLTCARGGSAVAISEFVLAAMLSFEKQLPELWNRPPQDVFTPAELGGLHGRSLGLVGLPVGYPSLQNLCHAQYGHRRRPRRRLLLLSSPVVMLLT